MKPRILLGGVTSILVFAVLLSSRDEVLAQYGWPPDLVAVRAGEIRIRGQFGISDAQHDLWIRHNAGDWQYLGKLSAANSVIATGVIVQADDTFDVRIFSDMLEPSDNPV